MTCDQCGGAIHREKCLICEMLATGETPGGTMTNGWPLKSEALAVHPKQRAEAEADARKKGVPTEFDRAGRPVFRDRGHRKKYLKAYCVVDKNSFTGY